MGAVSQGIKTYGTWSCNKVSPTTFHRMKQFQSVHSDRQHNGTVLCSQTKVSGEQKVQF